VTHRLLLEVGTEELPPSEMPTVLPALDETARRMLSDVRLGFETLRIFTSPRRLALAVTGLDDRQPPRTVRVMGPPRKAGFDAQGKPTKAAEGFARSQGVGVAELITVGTDRGEYLAADRHEAGRAAVELLPDLLERLVLALPFAKQMRWGNGEPRFVRPVRWLVALLDDAVLPMSLLGVMAGRTTYGHRFLAPGPIELPSADVDQYVNALLAAHVIADVETRRDTILGSFGSVISDRAYRTDPDARTLDIVVHLVEDPTPVVGTFPKEYLDLPREVVETPIRHHQKSFTVETLDGKLAPFFVTISNMPGADPTEVRRGNERVIRARLADADFYFREDLRITPEQRVALLAGMVFQERLGTLREKTDRLLGLVEHLGRRAPSANVAALRRGALLAKSDLASGMVREFPELEGVIGEEYALRAGEPATVAHAIREHYLPRSADGALPSSLEGAILSVADKIDTIVGCIGVGLVPTGSQDPYALRRHAQGVVQIALSRAEAFRLSLADAVDQALDLLGAKLTEPRELTRDRVLEFFRARVAAIAAARGWRADVIDAVLSSGFDEPSDVVRRIEALASMMRRDDWEPLVITFKRTINILPPGFTGTVEASRLGHEAERHLHEATRAIQDPARRALEAGHYAEALGMVAGLRPVVDAFFEAVLVMDRDPAVRDTRLSLLREIADLLLPVADLRRIQASSAA
jgi:glycyl-tRNA synthetase beta chain